MTKKTLIATLMAIGLTEEESKLYIFLTEHGANNVSEIARFLSLSRVTSYNLIRNLIKKQCITQTKQHKRLLYQAHDPEILLARFEQLFKEGTRELSLLSATNRRKFFVPEIKIYAGEDELPKIYDDVGVTLPQGGTYFRYTSRVKDSVRSPLYSRLRVEKELERLVITSEQKASGKKKDANRFIKTVPKDFSFDDDVTVLIYGSKVAHIDFNSNMGIVIESKTLATFQQKLFKLLWKKL